MTTPDIAKLMMEVTRTWRCHGKLNVLFSSDGAAGNDSARNQYYKDENHWIEKHPLMIEILAILSKHDCVDFYKHCRIDNVSTLPTFCTKDADHLFKNVINQLIDANFTISSDCIGFNYFDGIYPLPGKPVVVPPKNEPAKDKPVDNKKPHTTSMGNSVLSTCSSPESVRPFHSIFSTSSSSSTSSAIELSEMEIEDIVSDTNLRPTTTQSSHSKAVSVEKYDVNYKRLLLENILDKYAAATEHACNDFFNGKLLLHHFEKSSLLKMRTGLCIDLLGKRKIQQAVHL